MERKAVLKWLKIFSMIFLILSIVELLDLILFSSLITLNLDGSQYTIFSVIFQLDFMAIHAMLLWIILLCVISSFIVLSFSIFKVAKKNKIENYILAKFLLLIGLFLIIGGFIKTNFIILLGNSTINTGITTITFQDALYTPTITPLFGILMWIYFTVVISCFLVSGLIFGGIGLKWMLLIQEEQASNK
ncbi:MAG: hypothetical protein HWN80_05205 [Candidatus Lokiarchaeota archaeon]|nr:hypothetical protein [Candidatus Lokiarchaeota archaeon]